MYTAAPGAALGPGWLLRSSVLVLSVDISTPTHPLRIAGLVVMMSLWQVLLAVGGGVTSRRYARRLPHGFRRQGRPGEGPIRHTRPISIMRTLRPPDTPPRSARHRGQPSTCSLSRRREDRAAGRWPG